MNLKAMVLAASIVVACGVAPASAQSMGGNSRGSEHLSAASGLVIVGAASIAAGSGTMVVTSLEVLGDAVNVALKDASQAGEASIRISSEVAGTASLAVGSVVIVTTEAVGYALSAAGKLIAFIPNELGRSLLHHARYGERN